MPGIGGKFLDTVQAEIEMQEFLQRYCGYA